MLSEVVTCNCACMRALHGEGDRGLALLGFQCCGVTISLFCNYRGLAFAHGLRLVHHKHADTSPVLGSGTGSLWSIDIMRTCFS